MSLDRTILKSGGGACPAPGEVLKSWESARDAWGIEAYSSSQTDKLAAALRKAVGQVETLVGALRWYSENAGAVSWDCDSGSRARAALKAAELDNTLGESK